MKKGMWVNDVRRVRRTNSLYDSGTLIWVINASLKGPFWGVHFSGRNEPGMLSHSTALLHQLEKKLLKISLLTLDPVYPNGMNFFYPQNNSFIENCYLESEPKFIILSNPSGSTIVHRQDLSIDHEFVSSIARAALAASGHTTSGSGGGLLVASSSRWWDSLLLSSVFSTHQTESRLTCWRAKMCAWDS